MSLTEKVRSRRRYRVGYRSRNRRSSIICYLRAQQILVKHSIMWYLAAITVLLLAWNYYFLPLLFSVGAEAVAPLGARFVMLGERSFPLVVAAFFPFAFWSELTGKRAGLVYALPFERSRLFAARLLLPVAIYMIMLAAAYAVCYIVSEEALGLEVKDLFRGVPPVFFLLSLAYFFTVVSRTPMIGSGIVFLYWFAEYFTRGEISGRFHIFSFGSPLVEEHYFLNRAVLMLLALILAVGTFLRFRNNNKIARTEHD